MGGDGFFLSLREKVEAFFQFRKEGLSNFWIGTGFIAHHEREGGGIGDGMSGRVVCEFRHREEFGPFKRLVLRKDPEERFKFLVDPFGFTVSLWVVGGGEGNVVIQEMSEFSCEGGGELRSLIRDDLVVKAELGEDVLEKDFGDVRHRGGFIARAENYPLQKAMVYHDQNRVKSAGEGEICDKIHGDLLERAGTFGGDRDQGGVCGVGVDFIGLACGAPGDEFLNEGGHARPPTVFLEESNSVEVSAMSASEGFVDVHYKRVMGRFGDVEAALIVEGTLIEVPVLGGGAWQRNGGGFHGGKGIGDELVGKGGFCDFGG